MHSLPINCQLGSRAGRLCHPGHASMRPMQLDKGHRHSMTSHRLPTPQSTALFKIRRSAGATAADVAPAEAESGSPLELFLGWALANGVDGIGREDSKAGIFEGEHGERGLASLQDIERGETILRVPLRLALSEHPSDEESNSLVYAGAPWSVRLAAKLLRMRRAGGACPWLPYLQVLPEVVPSPHTTFEWEDIQEIQYEPMLRDFDHASWVASSAQRQLSAEATGGADERQLDWALSIIHSRSFGSPGEGGVAVRMLVPLVDLLNHAGDEYQPGGGGGLMGAAARDNVRWDVEPPAEEGGEWHMKVSATRDIESGEELLLSYGERGNDSFFQHYGFIPPRNPHDDVTLFDDIGEAVQWLTTALASQGPSPPEPTDQAAAQAAALEAAARYEPPLGPQPAPTSEQESEVMAREAARVKLLAGARLDGRLMAAFNALQQLRVQAAAPAAAESSGSGSDSSSSNPGAVMAARQRQFHGLIALRCRELLEGMPTSLLEDLERLTAWERGAWGDRVEGHGFACMLQQYRTDIKEYCQRAGTSLEKPFGVAGASAVRRDAGTAAPTQGPGGEVGAVVDAGLGALGAGDEGLLSLLRQLAEEPTGKLAAVGQEAAERAEQAAAPAPAQRSMLPVIYRAYKKMILWDAVLAAAACE